MATICHPLLRNLYLAPFIYIFTHPISPIKSSSVVAHHRFFFPCVCVCVFCFCSTKYEKGKKKNQATHCCFIHNVAKPFSSSSSVDDGHIRTYPQYRNISKTIPFFFFETIFSHILKIKF